MFLSSGSTGPAHKMQAAISETSPQKAGRRVLGEKTANASLTPATKRFADANSQKTQTIANPFNTSTTKTLLTKTRDNSSDACHAGQKRSIDQVVDNIEEAESEPRKVLMISQTGEEGEFEIFSDDNGTQSRQIKAHGILNSHETEEGSLRKEPSSRVPTEPAARKQFIQQRAALARSRLQSAMRRVGDKSLDRALSQFEANSRPFLRTWSFSSASGSHQQHQEQRSQNSSPAKQKRVLLPPLPLQPRSKPVRSSAQTTAASPSSKSLSIGDLPDTDSEAEASNEDDDNDKTPKQNNFRQENNLLESQDLGVPMSQESDSVMDKLIKWTQSSTDSVRAET